MEEVVVAKNALIVSAPHRFACAVRSRWSMVWTSGADERELKGSPCERESRAPIRADSWLFP